MIVIGVSIAGRIVQVVGANKAIEIYKETQKLEADGGMLVMVSLDLFRSPTEHLQRW